MATRQEQLRAIEARLREELKHAEQEITELDEQVRSFGETLELAEGVDNHPGDDSDTLSEQERLMTIRERLATRKSDIEHALSKIDGDAFGKCERCGREIPAGRLEALPFARYCVDCQEVIDQGGVAAT